MFRSGAASCTAPRLSRLDYARLWCTRPHRPQASSLSRNTAVRSNIGDDMMDFLQAGPKLRKWYGETDKLIIPGDGGPDGDSEGEDEDEPVGPREAIVVVGADSELGQLIVMQLVLARSELRVLVRDAEKMQKQFGPYTKVVQGDVENGKSLKKVMQGAKSVVVCGPVGQSARAAASLGLEHIVLPSALAPAGLSLGSLFGNPESSIQGQSREAEVMGGPVPYTVVRFDALLDQVGGQCGITLTPQSSPSEAAAPGAPITREDAAIVIARALVNPPTAGKGTVCFVGADAEAAPPTAEQWQAKFAQLGGL